MPPEGTSFPEIGLEQAEARIVTNYINGTFVPPSTGKYLTIESPLSSSKLGSVALSSKADVNDAVVSASAAFQAWSSLTMKSRASIMMKFHYLVQSHSKELAELIVLENGKNMTEGMLIILTQDLFQTKS